MLPRVVEGMEQANFPDVTETSRPDSGIHYNHIYQLRAEMDIEGYEWQDDYRNGYANPDYFERIDFLDWILREGKSASEGIQAWLEGLTIADCNTTIQAIQYDTIRAAVGNERFDEIFGSTTKEIAKERRLRIAARDLEDSPLASYLIPTEVAEEPGKAGNTVGARQNIQVGEWYYFGNYPKYLLKHPGSNFAGEHSLYVGKTLKGEQLWSGFGIVNVTEEGMLEEMVKAYNQDQSDADREEIARLVDQVYEDNWDRFKDRYEPEEFREEVEQYVRGVFVPHIDVDGHDTVFPNKISVEDILSASPYRHPLSGDILRPGLHLDSGRKLDAEMVRRAGSFVLPPNFSSAI